MFYLSRFGIVLLVFLTSVAHAYEFEKRLAPYAKHSGPGVAVAILKDGKTLFSKGYGWDKVGPGKRKITPETNFNLASNSKQFTAFALQGLVQRGLISLEDKVSKYIPELPNDLGSARVKHLVFHTSGAPDYMAVCPTKKRIFNSDVLAYLSTLSKPEFEPGSKHEYSNTGYLLLSEVIARAAKKPFPEVIRSEIFDKLEMKHSTVFSLETEAEIRNRSLGVGEWPHFETQDDHPCNTVFGDGGVYTSLNDYTKWALALQNAKTLSPKSHAGLFAAGTLDSGSPIKYAFGWLRDDYHGHLMLAHGGAWVGFRSFVAHIPDQKLWVIVFSNYRGFAAWDTIDLILKEFLSVK